MLVSKIFFFVTGGIPTKLNRRSYCLLMSYFLLFSVIPSLRIINNIIGFMCDISDIERNLIPAWHYLSNTNKVSVTNEYNNQSYFDVETPSLDIRSFRI